MKYEVLRQLKTNIKFFDYNDELTVEQLYGEGWYEIPPGTRRQAAKLFKIGVASQDIRGVYFSHQRSDKAWIYIRIPVMD